MKNYRFLGIVSILLVGLVASACSAQSTPTTASVSTDAPVTEEISTSTPEESPVAAETDTPVQVEGCLGSADTALVDLNCEEITIAVENAYLPFNYIILETGEPGGWDYDTWNEICTRLHCKPVFVEAAWDGLIQGVADGLYKVGADGVTITDDRSEIVDFSEPYIKIQQRLLERKGETRFESIEDLASNPDFIIATQTSTTNYETAVQYISEDRIKAFDQMPFAVQALLAGDADAVIMDEIIGMGYQGENAEQLELLGPSISSDGLGFLYPKGSELKAPVDVAIQAMIDDGVLLAINETYFGASFALTYDDIQ